MRSDILYAARGAKWAAAACDSLVVVAVVVVFTGILRRSGGASRLCLNVSSGDGERLLCPLSCVQCAPMMMMDRPV